MNNSFEETSPAGSEPLPPSSPGRPTEHSDGRKSRLPPGGKCLRPLPRSSPEQRFLPQQGLLRCHLLWVSEKEKTPPGSLRSW